MDHVDAVTCPSSCLGYFFQRTLPGNAVGLAVGDVVNGVAVGDCVLGLGLQGISWSHSLIIENALASATYLGGGRQGRLRRLSVGV